MTTTVDTLGALADAIRHTFLIPESHADYAIGATEAARMLSTDEHGLAMLIAGGLPVATRNGDPHWCWFDLFNLGLRSGTGRTLPERAFGFALRWMQADPSTWMEPRAWTMCLHLQARDDDAGGMWTIAPVVPGVHDVIVDRRQLDGVSRNDTRFTTDAPTVEYRIDLRTHGDARTLLDREAREIVDAFLGRGLRWARLPESLQQDTVRLHGAGVTNCISACIELEAELRRAGRQVRTRRGWILGMLDIEHSWLELVDVDGDVKVIDPVFAMFGRMLGADAYADACYASCLNRVVPTDHVAQTPLVTLHRDGRLIPSTSRVVTTRRAPELT